MIASVFIITAAPDTKTNERCIDVILYYRGSIGFGGFINENRYDLWPWPQIYGCQTLQTICLTSEPLLLTWYNFNSGMDK